MNRREYTLKKGRKRNVTNHAEGHSDLAVIKRMDKIKKVKVNRRDCARNTNIVTSQA